MFNPPNEVQLARGLSHAVVVQPSPYTVVQLAHCPN